MIFSGSSGSSDGVSGSSDGVSGSIAYPHQHTNHHHHHIDIMTTLNSTSNDICKTTNSNSHESSTLLSHTPSPLPPPHYTRNNESLAVLSTWQGVYRLVKSLLASSYFEPKW